MVLVLCNIREGMCGAVNLPISKNPEITFWEMLFPCPAVAGDVVGHF